MPRETNGFQKGDVVVKIEGRTYQLRLTLGALAHIESRLEVKGPLELAQKIRDFSKNDHSPTEALALLDCVLCTQDHDVTQVLTTIKRARPCEYMPALARLFEETFAGTAS